MLGSPPYSDQLGQDDWSSPVILVADDDPAMRLILRHTMEQDGYQVLEATNGLEAIQITSKQLPDLILMDAVMPTMDGFEATVEIKAMAEHADLPILVITSLDDDRSVSRAFEAGAYDYITKPVNWAVLRQRVRRMLNIVEAERKIRHLAYHDPLTGLPNRLLFMDRMDQAICRAMRSDDHFALLFIDIDNFKVINDSMGHDAGDMLLTEVTRRLNSSVRRSDTIARLGGDEFTVILENVSEPESVVLITKSLLEVLSDPITINQREVHVGASIGIAMYPQDGTSFGHLLKNADTAMYRAKALGRNTFQFYTSEMSTAAMRRLDLENSLRYAIEKEEFIVYYQPKYDLKDGRCIGMEALVRWDHPEKGLVPPDEFIPLAEETGMIVPLGEWVIRKACAQLRDWQKSGYAIDDLSINVSPRQFHEQDLCALFRQVLNEYELDPGNIQIELTESVLVENQDTARQVLADLHSMGLNIALDDFGTGYASMAYLRDFPIDTVKIDRSFVLGIPSDRENIAIVRAIAGLTNALGLDLIAEGVETAEQVEFLKNIECYRAQGYFWSKPVSSSHFEQEILKRA